MAAKSVDPLKALSDLLDNCSQREVASALGVSTGYLNDVLRGRTEPGEKILAPLGIERVVSYRRVRK